MAFKGAFFHTASHGFIQGTLLTLYFSRTMLVARLFPSSLVYEGLHMHGSAHIILLHLLLLMAGIAADSYVKPCQGIFLQELSNA